MKRELDHCGVAVKSLDRGREAYERLGFRLTVRSFHSGARTAGGPVEPWGSGNHCAMFREGYLEIIGLTDASMYSSVKPMVERYEGLHIVAIGVENADGTFAHFQKAGAPVESVRGLERDAAFGPDDREVRRAKFRNLYVDRVKVTEGRFIFIEHVTRDVLWQPHLMEHPNGAIGLEAIYFVVADIDATLAKFSPLFSERIERFPGGAKLALDRGDLWLAEEKAWRDRVPGQFVPPVPSPAGFGLRVKSIDAARKLLESNGVRIHSGMNDKQFWVAPEDACGSAIQFMQSEK